MDCGDGTPNFSPWCKQPADACSDQSCGAYWGCDAVWCAEAGGYCRDCGGPPSDLCIPRCPDNPCVLGETCREDGSCTPTHCVDDVDCPANFQCSGSAGACARRSCSADGDCTGFCLEGTCYEEHPHCAICY